MGKIQHYIPQFLLRNFSIDTEQKQINVYLLKQDKVVLSSIATQAKEDYLYGANQILEKEFQRMENVISSSVRKILSGEILLSDVEKQNLLVFIMFQYNRTPAAEKYSIDQYKLMAQEYVRLTGEYKNDEKLIKHADSISVKFPTAYYNLFKLSIDMLPYINDLRFMLLSSTENQKFIIGQQPVVLLNPFLWQRKWPGAIQAIGLKGTLIVMPISPDFCISFYDNIRYGFQQSKNIVQLSDSDVLKINYCQFLQTNDCVFFGNNIKVDDFKRMSDNSYEFRTNAKPRLKEFEERKDKINNNDKSRHMFVASEKAKKGRSKKPAQKLLMYGSHNLPIEQNFDFIAIKYQAINEQFDNWGDAKREHVSRLQAIEEERKKEPSLHKSLSR